MESQNPENPRHQTTQNPIQTSPNYTFPSNFFEKAKENLSFRSKWAELNGAMGDLGTYIPIVLALTLAKDLNLGTTLIFTGVYNIATGMIYGVPMPVQPMKSIAAVAISNPNFAIPEIMAAGICTAGIVFFLGVTQLMEIVYKIIPLPIVRGIQLSQGLSFAMSAVNYIKKEQDFAKSKAGPNRHWLGLDGLLLAIICACFIIIVNGAGEKSGEGGSSGYGCDLEVGERPVNRRKGLRRIIFSLPSAFLIFLLGVILAVIRGPKVVKGFRFGPAGIEVVRISRHSWKEGFIKGTIPQLPLSLLNSVIAVCKLSSDLFPDKSFSATSVSMTVGLMNLVGCWFGAMPCCHGAGGLAGQYKFGGRSGGCVALLGMAKLVIGLVLGSSIVKILDQFPVGVLGVLLLFAGIELAMASRDMNSKEEAFVMLLCTAVSLVGSGASLGFLCGIVAHFLLKLRDLDNPREFPQAWMGTNS
ncbi:TATA-binding protein-associated factor mot1 [Ancistrocladus abbreviatus]